MDESGVGLFLVSSKMTLLDFSSHPIGLLNSWGYLSREDLKKKLFLKKKKKSYGTSFD